MTAHVHAPSHGYPDHDSEHDVTEPWLPDESERAAIELLTGEPCVGPVRTTRAERAVIGRVAKALSGDSRPQPIARTAWEPQDGIRTPPEAPGAIQGVA